jgi:hypothetical protein
MAKIAVIAAKNEAFTATDAKGATEQKVSTADGAE